MAINYFKLSPFVLGAYYLCQSKESTIAQCLPFSTKDPIYKLDTDVYVWGNGYQADFSHKYGNFFPKKINNFTKEEQIVNVQFGRYHEAYLTKDGKIKICTIHKQPSLPLENVDDNERKIELTLEVPKG